MIRNPSQTTTKEYARLYQENEEGKLTVEQIALGYFCVLYNFNGDEINPNRPDEGRLIKEINDLSKELNITFSDIPKY